MAKKTKKKKKKKKKKEMSVAITDYNRLVVAKMEGEGYGIDWEFGVSRGKLLYLNG